MMGIQIENLNESHKGRWVEYRCYPEAKLEKGRIKCWNKDYIFVVYNSDSDWDDYASYSGCATDPLDLDYTTPPGNLEV